MNAQDLPTPLQKEKYVKQWRRSYDRKAMILHTCGFQVGLAGDAELSTCGWACGSRYPSACFFEELRTLFLFLSLSIYIYIYIIYIYIYIYNIVPYIYIYISKK